MKDNITTAREQTARDVAAFYVAELLPQLNEARISVRVLALTAPWAKTHGTEHTVARAREAGLVVEVRACPAELGPREVRT